MFEPEQLETLLGPEKELLIMSICCQIRRILFVKKKKIDYRLVGTGFYFQFYSVFST